MTKWQLRELSRDRESLRPGGYRAGTQVRARFSAPIHSYHKTHLASC